MTAFQYFRIGNTGIGHMGLHGIGAGKVRPGSRAAADGFVVLMLIVTKTQVIHGALRSGQRAERAVERIGYALRRFHVAGNHGSRWVYVSPDGASHPFFPTVHEDVPESDPTDVKQYTRDSTYLRMKVLSNKRIVQLPDGTEQVFKPGGDGWRVVHYCRLWRWLFWSGVDI